MEPKVTGDNADGDNVAFLNRYANTDPTDPVTSPASPAVAATDGVDGTADDSDIRPAFLKDKEAERTGEKTPIGRNGERLIIGGMAEWLGTIGKKKNVTVQGVLLEIVHSPDGTDPQARVRATASNDPFGILVPAADVSTAPLPTSSDKSAKTQREHFQARLKEFHDAVAKTRGEEVAGPSPETAATVALAPEPEPSLDPVGAEKPAKPAKGTKENPLKGHNGGVSDATLIRHAGAIRAAKEKQATATAELRNARKRAQDDGVDLKTLDGVMAEMKMAPDELIEAENTRNNYRMAFALPAWEPKELEMNEKRSHDELLEHAEREGLRAGLRGANLSDSQYDPDTEAGARWVKGYDAGQSKLRGKLGRGKD